MRSQCRKRYVLMCLLEIMSVVSLQTWPRFLVTGSNKLSPFAIQKRLEGLVGEPKSVKKLRNGSLFVECATENHSRNGRSKILCNVPIQVSLHAVVNMTILAIHVTRAWNAQGKILCILKGVPKVEMRYV